MTLTGPSGIEAPEVPPLRRNRDFRLLWTGAGSSLLGVRVAVSAYPLLMLWSGGSPADAGLVAFAALLPQLFLLLPAGALVDRWNRRRVMIVCDMAGALAMGSLVAALVTGRLWLPHVMAVAFVEGGAVSIYRLAERAAVRHVVHPTHLSAALSQNEARGHAAGLLGQPVGSALFTVFRWLPFCLATFTHLVAMATLLLIRKDFQGERTHKPRDLKAEIREGIAWVWHRRFMRAAILLVGGSNLAFQLISLALVLIVKEGGHPAYMVGALGLLGGLGGVLGAAGASWFMRRLPIQGILIAALAFWSALMFAVAFVDHPFGLGALMAGMSGAGALLNVAAGVHQVQVTPDEMQGRVTSVFGLVGSGLNSFGALVGGVLLAAFGSTNAVLGTAAAMAVLALVAVATPSVRRPPVEEQ
ncbi:MFS transporter [Streptomyces sp. MD20-1-1]|uniref:MFS transporter n=1 Tax=Streptomyces sp. MD20-1-1 TaxID=3028668 RepID=UPI0029A8FEEA|nr:MFS transporter [Streptomyces sp. MD20-1-1]